MVFIPTVSHIPPQQTSLEAQELTREIEKAITEYQENHPAVRQQDIQQALQLARASAGIDVARTRTMLAIAVGLVLMAGLLTAFLFLA